jgi:regulatory protein
MAFSRNPRRSSSPHQKKRYGRRSEREEEDEPKEPSFRDGTITRLVMQKRDKTRASVFVDDQFAFGLQADLVVEEGLRKGQPITAARSAELVAKDGGLRARRVALDYVAGRARTEAEVRRKLARKGFSESDADGAVDKLLGYGYLDDESYALDFVKSRHASKGYGPSRLRQDLRRRGIAPPLIDKALAQLEEEADLDDAAYEHAEKRWRRLSGEDDLRKRRKKTYDYLLRRGYGFDDARRAVERVEAAENES